MLMLITLFTGCGADGQVGTEAEPEGSVSDDVPEGNLSAPESVVPESIPPAVETDDDPAAVPEVFMTTDISADGLIAIYEALEASPTGNIAVKLSTGEPGSNYLRTDLIGPLVQSFNDPTIVECNTAYGGARANTAIADVDIMDEEGSMTLPVEGGANLTENYVGSHFANYDYYVVLSHF